MKKFRIYQLDKNNEKAMSLLFGSYDQVKRELKQELYKVVYEDEIDTDLTEVSSILDEIYQMFNIGKKPDGYNGRSLSTSDIVYIDEGFWYCDDYGWVEVRWK